MPWTREENIFCVITYLETKSFKTVSKEMQLINDLFLRESTKKDCIVLEADVITI